MSNSFSNKNAVIFPSQQIGLNKEKTGFLHVTIKPMINLPKGEKFNELKGLNWAAYGCAAPTAAEKTAARIERIPRVGSYARQYVRSYIITAKGHLPLLMAAPLEDIPPVDLAVFRNWNIFAHDLLNPPRKRGVLVLHFSKKK